MDNSKVLDEIFKVSYELYEDMSDVFPDQGHMKIFSYLTRLGKTLVEADRASFWKWDKKAGILWTTAATETDTIVIPDKTGLVGKALREGKVIITNDPYNDPDFNPEVDKKTGYVTRSVLVMPISNIKGEYIGAYQVINKMGGDGKFNLKEDTSRLSLAAVICGLALESDVFMDESYTDRLTGLKNRMGFYSDFSWKYDVVLKDQSRKMSLFICDIDKFKLVNDTYGHNAGDDVLKAVSSIIAQAGGKEYGVYRWGGEEFIMIMPDLSGEDAVEKAEEIRRKIEQSTCRTSEGDLKVTMSFGVALYDPSKDIAENIRIADKNLYTAKETGRNRVIY